MSRDIPPALSEREDVVEYGDVFSGARIVHVVIGRHAIGNGTDQMLVTTLGSCVAACASDPVLAIGGMNHFLLPEAPEGQRDGGPATRYGRVAMDALIEALLAAGCQRERLVFKVFGAGHVIPSRFDIARLNTDFILSYLRQEGLALVGQDLGGAFARRVFYYPATGRVMRRVMRPVALSDTVNQELHFLSLCRSSAERESGRR
jgi:chemotaxis protein CheD